MDPVRDGPAIRGRLGVCPQLDNLDPDLTVRENLTTYARYFGIPRAEARRGRTSCWSSCSCTDRADSKVEPLSGGMKRRLTIARALVNEPDLVLLDEPTTGLDPQARHLLWERLFRLKQRGMTLVLTTHYMDEAEQLCDRLVVMDGGRIVAEGSPRSLIETYSTRPRWWSCGSATSRWRVRGRQADRASASGSTRCRTGSWCTPTTGTRRCRGAPARATPPACWCAGRRWRTCSCS